MADTKQLKFYKAGRLPACRKKIKRRYCMNIEKDGKIYDVKENQTSWTITLADSKVVVSAKITKADCPTFKSLNDFITENDTF